MINCRFFFCIFYAKYYFLKNTDPKNQIILFLFCQPTDPIFFAVWSVGQKIDLVSPYNHKSSYIESQVNCFFRSMDAHSCEV